jgi:uncharacterized protein
MMPFFFGERPRLLFGAYDPPQATHGVDRAAVICAPWGNEYTYSHRTLRQVALHLSQAGFHVLRFDYYAAGDSAGASGDNDYAGSRADVEAAWAELKEIAGVSRVCLVGLRFGASVAADFALRRAAEVESLLLWEPLTALNGRTEPADTPKDFGAPDLDEWAPGLPVRSLVLTANMPEPDRIKRIPVNFVPCEPPWTKQNLLTGAIPVKAVRHIVNWLR